MRDAITQKTEAVLGRRLDLVLADLIGTVHGGGGRARNAHHKYRESLERRGHSGERTRPS